MSRRVGDAKRRFGVHDHCLGRDSAGPEHRRLSRADCDGVAIVRVSKVGDADGFGRTNLNWRAVDAGHARRDGHRCGHLGIWDRPHADHHIAAEHPRRCAGNVSIVHRYVDALFDLAHGNVSFEKRRLKREAAPDEETDQIVPFFKIVRHIGGFLGQLAVSVNAVARDVAGNIAARRKLGKATLPGIGYFQQRAGLGVALAKQQEVPRQRFRQHHQIALSVAIAVAGGGGRELARANQGADLGGGGGGIGHGDTPLYL